MEPVKTDYSPITLPTNKTYEDLKSAHETGTPITGDPGQTTKEEERLYPQSQAQTDATKAIQDELNQVTTFQELGNSTSKAAEVSQTMGLDAQQKEIRATQQSVVEALAAADHIKNTENPDKAYLDAVDRATESFLIPEISAAETQLIETVAEAIANGHESAKVRTFISEAGFTATTETKQRRVAKESLQIIAESEKTASPNKIGALIKLWEQHKPGLDERTAGIFTKELQAPIKDFDQAERPHQKAVELGFSMAEELLDDPDLNLSERNVIESASQRLARGDESKSGLDFIKALQYKAQNGSIEQSTTRLGISCLQEIAGSNQATETIRKKAIRELCNFSGEKMDQNTADILVKFLEPIPADADPFNRDFLEISRNMVLKTIKEIVESAEPNAAEISLVETAVQKIIEGDEIIAENLWSTLEWNIDVTKNRTLKNLYSTPFRAFMEGKTQNPVLKRIRRETLAKAAYPF